MGPEIGQFHLLAFFPGETSPLVASCFLNCLWVCLAPASDSNFTFPNIPIIGGRGSHDGLEMI